jgi:hypothetical protein
MQLDIALRRLGYGDEVDLGIVVVDDAHAALTTTAGQFRLTVPASNPAYDETRGALAPGKGLLDRTKDAGRGREAGHSCGQHPYLSRRKAPDACSGATWKAHHPGIDSQRLASAVDRDTNAEDFALQHTDDLVSSTLTIWSPAH